MGSFDTLDLLPWHRRSSYEPDAPARGVPLSPRWRVGLVCARMRNFLAGVISLILSEIKAVSTTYRSRLDVVLAGLGLSVIGHALNVLAFFLVGKMLCPTGMTTTLAQHYLMVPLILFSTVAPLPFGALGLSEGISDQLLRMVGHPGGALAMMGFRVLAYGCGLIAACVYLTNQGEVRALSASALHRMDRERVGESEGGEDQDQDQPVKTSRSRRNAGEELAVGR